MKKLFTILSISLILISPFSGFNFANADNTFYYAKVMSSDAIFYSYPFELVSNQLFTLPETYFVKILDEANEIFYYAQYKDAIGYVQKEKVSVMNGTPNNPYASATFRTFLPDGLGLYSKPTISSEDLLVNVPYLTESLDFYGYISGEEAIPDKTDQWIYCNFDNGQSNFGYLYSVFCDNLTQIQGNNEIFEIIDNPSFTLGATAVELSPVAMTFIIIGVSIPCLIVIYLLIKPTFLKEKVLREKPKIKHKRHGDYFEFDDSELN